MILESFIIQLKQPLKNRGGLEATRGNPRNSPAPPASQIRRPKMSVGHAEIAILPATINSQRLKGA